MFYLIEVLFVFLFLGYFYAPFPYWPTYFLLWKNILFNYAEPIPLKTRIRQAIILLRYGISSPFFTLLWYLDELIYPSYKCCEVKPIFIIGTPRSGTTFLHRTLTEDENTFFAIRHIEWRYPFIILQKLITLFGIDEKIKKMNYWPATEAGLKAAKMHAQTLYDCEEDAIFFEECFLNHFFILLKFPYRNLLSIVDDFEHLPKPIQLHIMHTHRRVIQKIMFLRGQNKIYLSKEVTSHSKLNLITEMYPETRFIVNLRPSNEFLSSLTELIRLSTLTETGIDILLIKGFKLFYIERMRKESALLLAFLDQDSEQKKICISYNQLIKNIKEIVKYIYSEFNLHVSTQYEIYLKELWYKQDKREKKYDYKKEIFSGFESIDQLITKVEEEVISSR